MWEKIKTKQKKQFLMSSRCPCTLIVVVGHYFINSAEVFHLFMQLVIQGMIQSGDLNNSVFIFNFLDWALTVNYFNTQLPFQPPSSV